MLPRNVNPAHALRTPIVSAVEDAVAPAAEAAGSTQNTVADPTDLKADAQDQSKADATQTDTPKTAIQDVKYAVKDSDGHGQLGARHRQEGAVGGRITARPQREEAGGSRLGE